jgi:peptidyl-prolyl cis-trans isomerase A (cyclophilin A)
MFTIKVTRSWAPNGADRFYNLVRAGFFTDVAFFRVIPGFMAQFGISPNPAVSRIWANANITDDPVKESNTRGTITFAQTSARNSRSTQFFINYGDNSRLNADRFAPFGEVTKGMDVVDKIAAVPLGGQGPFPPAATPVTPIIIKKVTVTESPAPNPPSFAR